MTWKYDGYKFRVTAKENQRRGGRKPSQRWEGWELVNEYGREGIPVDVYLARGGKNMQFRTF